MLTPFVGEILIWIGINYSFLENIFGFSNSDNKNAETIKYNDDKEIYMTESIEDNYISLECSEKMLSDIYYYY